MLPGGLELAPTPVALAHWSAAILCVAVVFVLNLIERDLRAIKALNHFACLVALWNTARAATVGCRAIGGGVPVRCAAHH